MVIQMTREEFEKKYGRAPNVPKSNGTTTNTTPALRTSSSRRAAVEPNEYGATFRASATDSPIDAGLKALGNLPSSAWNLGKNVFNAVTNPIDTLAGAGKAVVGGASNLGRALGTGANVGKPETEEEKVANAIGGYFTKRFGSVEGAQQAATEDPVGFGSDILAVLTGGAAAVGKTGAISDVISKAAAPVTKTASKVGGAISSGVREATTGAAGITTGVGKETFKQALKGGDEFTEAMRGRTNAVQVLNEANVGLKQVKAKKSEEYKTAFDDLAEQNPKSFDISPVFTKASSLLRDFGVKQNKDGTLDFSRSSLINDEKKVQAAIGVLKDWGKKGGDRTVRGVDNLKKQLKQFREGNNPTLNKFVEDLARSAQDVIKDVPGYKDIQTKYGAYSDFIDELERTLSLSDNATPDQSITKLNTLLKDNADYRRILVDEFKQITGKDLLSPIAGQALNKATPQGLAKLVAGGLGLSMPHLIPMLAFSSPRLMGEFFRMIGATNRTIGTVLSAINEFRVGHGLKAIGVLDKDGSMKMGMSIKDVSPKAQGGTPNMQSAQKADTSVPFGDARIEEWKSQSPNARDAADVLRPSSSVRTTPAEAQNGGQTRANIAAVRPTLKRWIDGDPTDAKLQELVTKNLPVLEQYKPTKPIIVYRAVPDGQEGLITTDRYTSWTTDRQTALGYGQDASGRPRKVVATIVDPEDIAFSVRMLDEAARKAGLKEIDTLLQSEIVLKPNTYNVSSKFQQTERGLVGIPKTERSPSLPKELEPLAKEARKYGSAEEFVKAQGVPLYHTTAKQFDSFDPRFKGTNTGEVASNIDQGFFFTDNIKAIDQFKETLAKGSSDWRGLSLAPKDVSGYRTIAKVVPKEKFFDLTSPTVSTKQAEFLSKYFGTEDGSVLKGKDAVRHIKELIDQDVPGETMLDYLNENFADFRKAIQKQGYEGVITDMGGGQKEYVIFNPNKFKTPEELTDFYNKVKSNK